jgi:hypothetical protein
MEAVDEQQAYIDLCVVPTLTFERLFAFLVLGTGRRQLLWFEVTRHPDGRVAGPPDHRGAHALGLGQRHAAGSGGPAIWCHCRHPNLIRPASPFTFGYNFRKGQGPDPSDQPRALSPSGDQRRHESRARRGGQACPKGLVCLVSALAFHQLTGTIPSRVWMAIGPKDRRPAVTQPPLQIARFGDKVLRLGLEEHRIEGVPGTDI